jgi:tetraacyldisaccharide 4'-kinase
MIIFRLLLLPFALIYEFITSIRNFLYNIGILKSYTFNIPVISVGNLCMGGTGKTPHCEFLFKIYQISIVWLIYQEDTNDSRKGYKLLNLMTM